MIKHHNYALGLTWMFILFVIPLPLIQTLAVGLPADYADEFQAIYFGAIAYSWMLVAIYLSTRPKWLDRLIGLPDMYVIHGILSIAAIYLIYLHQSETESMGWIKTTGNWAYWLLLGILAYSLIFMAGWLTSRVPFIGIIKKWLEPLFKHEYSIWIHRLTLVATVLVFIHVILINYVVAITPFMIWFYAYSSFVLVAYVWAKVTNTKGSFRGTLTKNIEIADNIRELTIRPNDDAKVTLLPGDYVFMSFPTIKGLRELHPFSLVNSPTDSKNIVLAIRGDGDFTRSLDGVPDGTQVKFTGGYGRYDTFLSNQPQDTNIVILAGGIGVVPLLSVVDAHPNRNIRMFYTAHREADLIYGDKFKNWQNREHFQIAQQVGRFGISEVLRSLPNDWQRNTLFLIGGPSKMMRHWKRELRRHGVMAGQIYSEEFDW
ncbi:FAD-binding oxidoreductase [Lentilactobacillus otakiensis]|uniref:FAD-binding oxidoreductase n=1 Tax=Lentilactobacillus otakiensis TaxID=481720 RepID=UPI0031D97616